MIFNINESYSLSNSGIESAQFNRFKMFKRHKMKFALLTVRYNPENNWLLKQHGLYGLKLNGKNEYINLYDYFQGIVETPQQKNTLKDNSYDFGIRGDFSLNYNTKLNKAEITQEQDGETKLICRMEFYDIKDLNDLKIEDLYNLQIKAIEEFDAHSNLVRYKIYDRRGFLSCEELYDKDNIRTESIYYTLQGKPVLYEFYEAKGNGKVTSENQDKQMHIIRYMLKDIYNNDKIQMFDTDLQLFEYFFNSVNNHFDHNVSPNIFVSDRSNVCQEAMLNIDAFTVFHYHNSHGGNVADEMYSIPNNNYEFSLENINRFDAIIVATENQKKDIQHRYKVHVPIYVIPVGMVPDKQLKAKRVPINKRINHSIIMTARIASEKQMEDMARAMVEIKKKFNDAKLDLYGYFDPSSNYIEKRRLEYIIKKYNLEDNISIHSYVQDTGAVQKQHQIYVVSSFMEGFNIALMEGLSQGCVGVSYNVNYGPAEIIKNNKNGYLIKTNDWQRLAQKIIYLFSHPERMQQMSDKAYEMSKRFSDKEIHNKWVEIVAQSISNENNDPFYEDYE